MSTTTRPAGTGAGRPGGPAAPGAPSPRRVPTVLLATFSLCPDGEPGGDLLGPLAARGVDARWACWDDPDVDWAAADLVAVRSTWDYHRRLPAFLAWAHEVERHTRAAQRRGGVRVERRQVLPRRAGRAGADRAVAPGRRRDAGRRARAGLAAYGAVVVKARTGASGVGVVVAEEPQDPRLAGLTAGPWLVQPLVGSVRTRGESSVFVLDGRAVSQVDKRPGGTGGGGGGRSGCTRSTAAAPARSRSTRTPSGRALAAMAAAAELLGRPLDYGRVDLMELDGRLVVGEVELIEPGLYLDVAPGNAAPFADLVRASRGRLTREFRSSPPTRAARAALRGHGETRGTRGRERP